MDIIKNNYDQYANWLSGADHSLTVDEINELRAYLFSPEADLIHSIAATELGARP